MADKYVPIFFDWVEVTGELNAQEKGRLIDAIVQYARGGDWQEQIKGNERYLFPAFRQQIDRAKDVSSKRAESGSSGGKQTQAKPSKAKQNEANASKCKQTEANHSKTPKEYEYKYNNEEEYENNNNNCCRSYNAREETATPTADTIEAYASGNLVYMSPTHMQELESFRDDLPDDVIRHGIDEACGQGVRKWAYVRAILNAYVDNGVKTVQMAHEYTEKRKQQKPGREIQPKDNPALQYQQREYDPQEWDEYFRNQAERIDQVLAEYADKVPEDISEVRKEE